MTNPCDSINIFIAGTPRARPRARSRAAKVGGKWIAVTYHPKRISRGKDGKPTKDSLAWARANEWYEAVRWAVREHLPKEPWEGPISLTADIYFERPMKLLKKSSPEGPIRHTVKPDRDNLEKSISDPLKVAGLMRDDSQVCDGAIRKWYVGKRGEPGVRLLVERLGVERLAVEKLSSQVQTLLEVNT